jgi:hypothetical protein
VNRDELEYEVREVLVERTSGERTEYLVQWDGYRPDDDTWELVSNLKNANGALRDFSAQGQATKGGEYHVMASVTEEIKKNQTERLREPDEEEKLGELTQFEQGDESGLWIKPDLEDQDNVTQGEQDSGIQSVSQQGSPSLTGRLCQRMMAVVHWQVGADKAVDDCMVQALEQWLCARGISIYTDRILP